MPADAHGALATARAAAPTGREEYVDAALFLGMHSTDEPTRLACKAFFVARLSAARVVMSWEQVGRCDDLVWGFPRAVQDAYYPFMDHLHTDMRIERRAYTEAELRRGLGAPGLGGLPVHERLLLGMVLHGDGLLRSASPRLLPRTAAAAPGTGHAPLPVLPADAPRPGREPAFPQPLEGLYQESLALRVPATAL